VISCTTVLGSSFTDPFFESIHKAELHLHLGGAYPKKFLFSIATPEQWLELEDRLRVVSSGMGYHDIFAVFHLISNIVNTEEKVKNGTRALCEDLSRDRVTYSVEPDSKTSVVVMRHMSKLYWQE